MVEKISVIIEGTKESIRNFISDPIDSLAYLVPVLIGLVAFISGVVTYIMFIVNGGYANQVGAFKEYGLFDGIGEAFTSGTTGLIVSGIVGKVILSMIGIEFVIMMINYFKNSGKAKRIIMIIDLVLLVVQTVLTITVFWIAIGNLLISEEVAYQALEPFDGMGINPKAILITYAVITVISLITFIILILITKACRWMVGYTALSLMFATIIVPLVFLLLQNIIPITGVIAVIVIGFIVCKVIEIFITDHPEDITWKKEELKKARQRSKDHKVSADANFRSARDGLNIVYSAEDKRKWGRKELEKASNEDEYARRLQEDIERLESKFGK